MISRIREHLASNLVGYLALFVALGGTSAYAVNQLSGEEIKKRSISGNRLKKNTVGGGEIKESKLGQVPKATSARTAGSAGSATTAESANTANSANTATSATTAGNANAFSGLGPGAFLRYGSTIPSGTTVSGVFADVDHGPDTNQAEVGVSFPLPAPADLAFTQVNFAPGHEAQTGDEDPTCTGTVGAPSAPAGKVCLYVADLLADANSANGQYLQGGQASRLGFEVMATRTGGAPALARGTWAYTAP
jgi:hypothetical protein